MVQDRVQAIMKLGFFDKLFKLVPDDPLIQSRYVYYLTIVIFTGLLGYATVTWYTFFTSFKLNSLFSGLFMSAIALISIFGLKQTRAVYNTTKIAYANKESNNTPLESPDEMLKQFEDAKKDRFSDKVG